MPKRPPEDEPVVFAALLRAARFAYGNAIRAALIESGLDDIPKNGIFVIGAISRSGAPLAQIIDRLGVSKQSAGQLVDTLALRGYIERDVDPEDRRRLTVKLTARGREAAAISRATVERIDAALAKKVGREHVAHTRATLHALIELVHGKR
ncbi:MAG TPA: MarR family transcriptional regulator [Rhizomicrobium sp.]|nr:MarR family transcriptional regulator [Rhizomicrobium sp.]